MDRDAIARLIDHSVLKPESTDADVRAGAALVRRLRIGFYCVQPWVVATAVAALEDTPATVVAVVGFPHGCERPATKASAAACAFEEGAREIDMVMNVGALRSGYDTEVHDDIAAVVQAVRGTPVKVILETAVLTDAEKRRACALAKAAGAAFVKTSTGFHPAGGATTADIALMRAVVGPHVGVKASGGVRTLADVEAMLAAGASRIGTSASEAILAAADARKL